jgi:hypothetical protein
MTERIGPAGVHEWLCRRCTEYLTKKKQPQHHTHNLLCEQNGTIRQRTMDNDPPPIKPWSTANKNYLQELIDHGKVDIGRSAETRYIDSVRAKYFRDRDEHNFRRNFRNYARSRELEDTLSGARRRGGGIVFLYIILIYLHHY